MFVGRIVARLNVVSGALQGVANLADISDSLPILLSSFGFLGIQCSLFSCLPFLFDSSKLIWLVFFSSDLL